MADDAIGFSIEIPDSVFSKLDKADEKLKKIQETAKQTTNIVKNSFIQMASGVDPFIKKLEGTNKMLQKISTNNLSKNLSGSQSSVERFTSSIVSLSNALDRVNKRTTINIGGTSGNTSDIQKLSQEISNLIAKYSKLSTEFEDYKRKRTSTTKAEKEAATAMSAYNRAMASSEGTMSQRINKIAKLRNAEEQLLKTGRDYTTELTRIRAEISRLNSTNDKYVASTKKVSESHSRILNTADQLQRKLALLFSVSQIYGYLTNLVNVRAEFELQNTALASLLQNKDKADQLFAQITELAVKSPFTVKELVTYTKNLAAYQVEEEKLYDTTKKLADVSAGLGVSMDRLILAYGQVKAANFLRGTEVRQFTEAGLNILGELADYYSELEGRMISVSEVQEMVTKRMVSFGDVEEVFNRVTSAGGLFYQMQEKQAETLQGQLSNLQDSIDIMFNKIGQENEGTIKDMLSSVREMVEGYKDIQFALESLLKVLSPIVVYMGLAKVASLGFTKQIVLLSKNSKALNVALSSMSTSLDNFAKRGNLAAKSVGVLKTAMSGLIGLGVGAVIAGIASGLVYLYTEATRASRQAEELSNNLSKIQNEGNYNAAKLSSNFKRLADIILTTSKNSKEYKDALSELKRTYGDILPEQTLTAEGLMKLKGNYEGVTSAIYSYIEARMKEKEITAISEIYGENVEKSGKELREVLIKEFEILPEDASKIITKFRQAVENGTLKATSDFGAFINSVIKEVTGLEKNVKDTYSVLSGSSFFGSNRFKLIDVSKDREEVIDYFNDVVDLQKKINEAYNTTLVSDNDAYYRALEESVKKVENEIVESKKRIAEEGTGDSFLISEKQLSTEREMLNKWITDFQSGALKIRNAYGEIVDPESQTALKFIDDVQKKIDSLNGDKAQQEIKNIVVEFANLNNIKLGGFEDIFKESSETMNDYRKRITSLIEDIEERLKQYSLGWSEYITNISSPEDAQRLREKLSILKKVQKEEFVKIPTKSESKSQDKVWTDRINLIQKAGKEYEKFLKYYSSDEATDKVRANFQDAFNDLQIGDILATMTFDTNGVIAALEQIGKDGGQKVSKEVNKSIASLKTEAEIELKVKGIDDIKNQVDRIFDQYDFFKELSNLNIGKELGEQIFNVEALDLEELEAGIKSYKDSLGNLGAEQLKIFENAEKKITEMQNKEREDRLKTYVQYLKKSVSERVKIEMDAQRQIAEVQKETAFTDDQKNTIIDKIKEDTQKALSSIKWNDFKGSDMYISLFEDLERTSTTAIEVMLNKLQELRSSLGNLDPSDLKDITSRIQKLQEELESRNPFKNLVSNVKDYIEYLKEKNDLESQYTSSVERESSLQEEIDLQSKTVALYEQEYKEAVKKYGVDSKQATLADTKLIVAKKNLSVAEEDYKSQQKITRELIKQIKYGETLKDKLSGAFTLAGDYANDLSGAINDIAGSLEGVFGSMSDKTADTISTITEVLGGVGDMASGAGRIMSGDIIGGSLQALKGLASTIGSLFSIGDKKKEREIQRQIALVDNLDKSYQKLAESIENAYSIDTLKQSNEAAKQNLQQQIDAYERMISLEKDKKKTDEDKIKDWEQSIEDLQEQQQQLEQDLTTSLGGIGDEADIKSAAEDFVDAWLNAYTEVGDGLSGLQDNFDEFIQNAVKKQLLTQLSSQFIDPILESFNKMFDESSLGGTDLTGAELDSFRELYEKYSELFDERAKAYLEALGIEPGTGGETAELSGLSKGIQSVTEETAQALEALLNSMRFFVADSNTQLKSIYAALTSQDALQNPILSEMKMQTALMQSLNNMFSSVIKSGHPTLGGSFIKVSM